MPDDADQSFADPGDAGTFDYVIVGAGSAGCVLANRLSADPDVSVLLLEAGGRDSYPWIHIPVGYLYTMMNPRTDWCFKTEEEPGLNGRAINYPRGKVLGGCSSINGMIYMRGQARDYDQWRQLGNTGWGWDDVLPYFLRSEDHWQGATEMHGAGGEWRVEQQRLRWDILDAFRDAAAENGIPKIDDPNLGDNEGSSFFQVNQRRGKRWNTAQAFLNPVKRRAEPEGRHPGPRGTAGLRRQAGRGRRLLAGRQADAGGGGGRSDSGRRFRRVAASAATFRRRARRTRCSSTVSPWCMPCPALAATCRTICSCA